MATTLQSIAVSKTAPTNGQVLTYNGSVYAPATPAAGGGPTLLSYLVDNTSQTTNSTTDVDLVNMSTGNITTSGGDLIVQFDCDARAPHPQIGGEFLILVDGNVVCGKTVRGTPGSPGVSIYFAITLSAIVQGLAAGTHVVKVQWAAGNANNFSTNSYGSSTTPTILQVWEV